MRLSAAGFFAALALFGCGQAQRPTSPSVFRKSDLQGLWQYSVDLVDPPAAIFSLATKMADVEKVQFDIQESYLFARPQDPLSVPVANANGVLGAWPVAAQFDLGPVEQRPSDALLTESGERPWYQREYMLLDNSNQLVPQLGGWSPWPSDVTVEPISTYNPTGPDSIHRNDLQGNGALRQFDVTDRILVSSPRLQQPGCAGSTIDCSSVILKVRHTFQKL